ncbi:MAG TPA: PfkB family carbohydrate kinase [Polyangia bacterium]|jgi:sugar/nucleoside kinase (ribokinase family)
MTNELPDVVGVGCLSLDQIGVGPRLRDPSIALSTFSLQAGGPTGTALATLAALGARARFFGRLGDDEFGNLTVRHLRNFGVDMSLTLREPERISPTTFILVEEDSGRRFIRYTNGDVTPLVAADIPPNLFDGVRLAYFDAEMPTVQIAAAARARARGARVLLGVRQTGPGLGELLDLADVVIASERVAAEIAHTSDMERSLVELTKMGPEIAIITLGDEGAVGLHEDKLVRQHAIDVEVADVTGAGSVFRGAYGYAMLQGWPLERALPFATAAAGLSCASLGGQGGIPTLEAIGRALAG